MLISSAIATASPYRFVSDESLESLTTQERPTPDVAQSAAKARQQISDHTYPLHENLTIEQAIQRALNNKANLRYLNAAIAAAELSAQLDPELPTTELRIGYEGEPERDSFGTALRIRFPNLAETRALRKKQEAEALLRLSELADHELSIKLETKLRYYNARYSYHLKHLYQEKINIYQKIVQANQDLLKSKQTTQTELLDVKVDALESEAEYATTALQAKQDMEMLGAWISHNNPHSLILTENFRPIPPITIAEHFEQCFAIAVKNSPELERLALTRNLIRAEGELEDAQDHFGLSFVEASADMAHNDYNRSDPDSYGIRMGIELPIFSMASSRGQLPELRIKEQEAFTQIQLQEIRDSIYRSLAELEKISARWVLKEPRWNELLVQIDSTLEQTQLNAVEKAELQLKLWDIKKEALDLQYEWKMQQIELEYIIQSEIQLN